MADPSVGRIVHYRLTRQDARSINRRRIDALNTMAQHRESRNGTQVHVGNSAHVGDVLPLLIAGVWPNEFDTGNSVCRDHGPADEELEWSFPFSHFGVNGQVFLDGNDSLWITSAPQGDFLGSWNWPERS